MSVIMVKFCAINLYHHAPTFGTSRKFLCAVSRARIQPITNLQKISKGSKFESQNRRERVFKVRSIFITFFSIQWLLLGVKKKKITDIHRTNVAVLHVYYNKEKTGMRYKTDIRFGVEDFICKSLILKKTKQKKTWISVLYIFLYTNVLFTTCYSCYGWPFRTRTWNELHQCDRNYFLPGHNNLIRLFLKTCSANQSDPGDIPIRSHNKIREWPSISTITTNNTGSVTSLPSSSLIPKKKWF